MLIEPKKPIFHENVVTSCKWLKIKGGELAPVVQKDKIPTTAQDTKVCLAAQMSDGAGGERSQWLTPACPWSQL